MADGRKAWVWVLHNSQHNEPILYSKLHGDEMEAIKIAETFAEEIGIEVRRAFKPRRSFRLIHGEGKNEE
jgi:hypothetical protein